MMAFSAETARGLVTNFHRVASEAAFDLTPSRKAAAKRRLPDVADELRQFAARCRGCSWSLALIDLLERAEAIVLVVDDVFPLRWLSKREVSHDGLRQQLAELKDGISMLTDPIHIAPDLPTEESESDGWLVPSLVGLEARLHFLADWMEELRIPTVPDANVSAEERQRVGNQRHEFIVLVGKEFKAAVQAGNFAADFAENPILQSLLATERNEQQRRSLSPDERDRFEEQFEARLRSQWDAQPDHRPEESLRERDRRESWDRWWQSYSQKSREQRDQEEKLKRRILDDQSAQSWAHTLMQRWLVPFVRATPVQSARIVNDDRDLGEYVSCSYLDHFRLLADAVNQERLRLMQPTAITTSQKIPAAVYVPPIERPKGISERRWEVAFHRDHVWLGWQNDLKLEPPAIRKKWNALPDAERVRLAKNSKASAKAESNQTVWVALAKAAAERSEWESQPLA